MTQNPDEAKEINEETDKVNKSTGFGPKSNMSFQDYQKWLADINSQNEMNEAQQQQMQLSDARTKNFINRGVLHDNVLRKVIGVNMMTNGMIDPKLLGFFELTRS